jgi:hypothetical protein
MIRLVDALAWRLGRHALDAAAATSVGDVADRVVAFRAWPPQAAAMTVATRLASADPGALDRALSSGEVIRSYALRGGSYVFTRRIAADLLAARRVTRIWETRRWQDQGRFSIDDWQPLRDAVRSLLERGPMTRAEISAGLKRLPALRPLAPAALGAGSDSLYKPLHWWGDISFGPDRDGVSTFQRLGLVSEPHLDDAGARAVRAYLHAYAPASLENLRYWLTEGLGVPRRRLHAWIDALGADVSRIEVDGVERLALAADVDAIAAARSTEVVRLLPAFDPWVFGPGTADAGITPPEHRALASSGRSLVLSRGRIAGTWRVRKAVLSVTSFASGEQPHRGLLGEECARLAVIRGEKLELTLDEDRRR